MDKIRTLYGPLLRRECALSSIPAGFVAALIANESAGDPTATRFEKHVCNRFIDIQAGKRRAWGGVSQATLASLGFEALGVLATSYGLTQIMGYNAALRGVDPLELAVPEKSIHLTLRMLAECCERFGLDPRREFEEMLGCWNTGQPYGKTYHANYRANGLARMKVYNELEGL